MNDIKCSSCNKTDINNFKILGVQNFNNKPYLYLVNCKYCDSTISTTLRNFEYLAKKG